MERIKQQEENPINGALFKLQEQVSLFNLASKPSPVHEIEGVDFPLSLSEALDRAYKNMNKEERDAYDKYLIEVSNRFGSGGP